jgi:hypothetical protein
MAWARRRRRTPAGPTARPRRLAWWRTLRGRRRGRRRRWSRRRWSRRRFALGSQTKGPLDRRSKPPFGSRWTPGRPAPRMRQKHGPCQKQSWRRCQARSLGCHHSRPPHSPTAAPPRRWCTRPSQPQRQRERRCQKARQCTMRRCFGLPSRGSQRRTRSQKRRSTKCPRRGSASRQRRTRCLWSSPGRTYLGDRRPSTRR